jgi:hypothetical protein
LVIYASFYAQQRRKRRRRIKGSRVLARICGRD